MKLFNYILVLLLSGFTAKAQSFAVSADKMNIAYIGIENPLTIVSDNCSCKDLFATTTNGTLTKGDSCHFGYSPTSVGQTSIIIQKKQNGKLVKIGEQVIRCKGIPDPMAMVGNKMTGIFHLAEFKVQQGVRADFGDTFEMDIKFKIVSFKISFYRNEQVIFTENTTGNLFSQNTIANFRQLKIGDKVWIEDIKAVGPNSKVRLLNDLMFTMR